MAGIRRRIAGLAILGMVGLATSPMPPARAAPFPGLTDVAIENLLAPTPEPLGALPDDPTGALANAVVAFGAKLGVPIHPQSALAAAHLDAGLAGRLALLLGQLAACHDATAHLLVALPPPLSAFFDEDATSPALPGAAVRAIRVCADRVQRGGLELERFLAAAPADLGGDVELWPVLRLDNTGHDDVVVNDYVLSVDRGGNDSYFNNAGGNAIDVRRGPAGSGAPETGPAHGCVNPAYDLGDAQCVLSASLLLDMAGDDTYGRMEPPEKDADAICTDESLVHRVLTIGAGFAGVGILIDASGNDTYVGKTVTEGAGHLGGVGILRDEAGDDTYLAMRLSKGFGILGGVGVVHDLAGNDRYLYYMPGALDPSAPYKTPGSGGGLSTTGLCDNEPRWDEGTGVAGGVGVLLEDAGDDVYQAGPPIDHLLGTTQPLRHTGSLGWGDLDGFGLMIDRSGHDRYSGVPGRADGKTLMPSVESTGIFIDQD